MLTHTRVAARDAADLRALVSTNLNPAPRGVKREKLRGTVRRAGRGSAEKTGGGGGGEEGPFYRRYREPAAADHSLSDPMPPIRGGRRREDNNEEGC